MGHRIRRTIGGAALVALCALGLTVAALATTRHTDNFGTPVVTCGQPIKVTFTDFPSNGKPNTVTIDVNGTYTSYTFTGSTGTYASTVVAGTGTWNVSEQWHTNGVQGSSGTVTKIACSPATTTGTTTTVTTPVMTTVTTPATTVTNTVTTPAPPAVTTTVTTPVPAVPAVTCPKGYKKTGIYTCLRTLTKTHVRTVVKWHTRTVTKTKTVVVNPKCPKPNVKQLCAAGGGIYKNGKCGFVGKG